MKNWSILALIYGLVIIIAIILVSSNQRHYLNDQGEMMQAQFIKLPGYSTRYYPEQTVELQKWAGSKLGSFMAVDLDGKENIEITASIALKAMGLYPDYELKQKSDGHWILYRPKKTEEYFTWSAFYQITPGEIDSTFNKAG